LCDLVDRYRFTPRPVPGRPSAFSHRRLTTGVRLADRALVELLAWPEFAIILAWLFAFSAGPT
jgi:hypothetical protein